MFASIDKFDKSIDDAITRITATHHLSDIQKMVRHLPGYLGGLSMSSARVTAPSAYKASFFTSASFIKERFPMIFNLLNFDGFEECMDFLDKPPTQKSLCLCRNKEIHSEVLKNLSNNRWRESHLYQSSFSRFFQLAYVCCF